MAGNALGRIKVFDVDVSSAAERAFGRLRQAKGFSGRAQIRMAQEMRDALELRLQNVIYDSGFPVRTGRSQRASRAVARGTSFSGLRGHLIGPANIKVLNDGAEINPNAGEYLAIPFGEALRADGTPKLPGPLSWKNVQKTFIYKSKKTGEKYVAYKRGGDEGTIVCLYVLVEIAEIQPRGFMDKAWRKQAGPLGRDFGQIMLAEIARVDLLTLARVTFKGRGTKGGIN